MTSSRTRGFTLIEILVVMAILATLLSLAAPKYFDSLERAQEAALRTDLRMFREAIDKHRGDTGKLPASLDALVQARYLQAVPVDPITDRTDTWVVVPSADVSVPGVFNVRSGAPGAARDGTAYASW
ncbi:prepilin-type N-terminal cleavage/methylation domain-containing protein [Rhizobacter sp. AJA081-3]|uniref:type II secretion system protein n=1 Tax=Rhizobacter sp. AJA081-3 TaxID=2753607 RepID=UPI001ADFB7A9|nr:prepilin-type N-terminal cleavage/methylation domain-containing protein [Rhizobacter sp. AJA081-3]QTN25670.1 prepilin-type N-terminal cleavage/methylation domain-containing protein [Rhizobacter sp. AJA081-3]